MLNEQKCILYKGINGWLLVRQIHLKKRYLENSLYFSDSFRLKIVGCVSEKFFLLLLDHWAPNGRFSENLGKQILERDRAWTKNGRSINQFGYLSQNLQLNGNKLIVVHFSETENKKILLLRKQKETLLRFTSFLCGEKYSQHFGFWRKKTNISACRIVFYAFDLFLKCLPFS